MRGKGDKKKKVPLRNGQIFFGNFPVLFRAFIFMVGVRVGSGGVPNLEAGPAPIQAC